MAIIVVSFPSVTTSALECLEWTFTMDDIGSPTAPKFMGYKLMDSLGNTIGKEESYRATSITEVIPLDFSDDVQGLVTTMIPLIDPGAANDNYIITTVTLAIWEIEHDTVTCESVISNYVELDPVKIVNGICQEYETNIIEAPLPGDIVSFLTHQPAIIKQCRDALNFMWVLGGAKIRYNTPSDTEVSLSPSFDAYYIPMHIRDVFPSSWQTAEYFDVTFDECATAFRVYLEECCCGAQNSNILFLDPKGGRSAISFDCVSEYTMDNNFVVIDRYIACHPEPAELNDQYNRLTAGGKTAMNKKNTERMTLVHTTASTDENAEWYKAFLASTGYHVQITKQDGTLTFRKFIVESGSFVYRALEGEIDLVITGYMAHNYKQQKTDR